MTARRIGAVLALAAAVMLLVGTFTMRWLNAPGDEEGGVGLTGVEMCRTRGGERVCKTADWDEVTEGARGKRVELVRKGSVGALVGSVAAATLFVALGVLAVATSRRTAVLGILAALGGALALGGAIVTVVLFRKYFRDDSMAFGYSFHVYCAGCVLGAVGSLLAARRV
ncbi:MAG: hypothetical protein K8M05_39870 [Deltaproteobacteria bacterium]|nr:hypothetical protein [Kofleriaceae bacterium]